MTLAHHDAGSCIAEVLEFQLLAADAGKLKILNRDP